jgi:hypothetical protein
MRPFTLEKITPVSLKTLQNAKYGSRQACDSQTEDNENAAEEL